MLRCLKRLKIFELLASSSSSFQVGVYRLFDFVASNFSAFHLWLSMVVKKFSPEKDTYNMLMIKEEKAEPIMTQAIY